MKKIKVLDKEFVVSIPSEEIQKAIAKMAKTMNKDLKGKDPLFIVILNGAFVFASDLLKNININCQVSFLKMASYHGTTSTGKIRDLIGIDEDLKGKTLVVVEDIVDTGLTLEHVLKILKAHKPAEIKIATFLFKPDANL